MKKLTVTANKSLVIGVLVSALFSASSIANEQEPTSVKLTPTATQTNEVKTNFTDDLSNTVQNQLNQVNAVINEKIDSSIQQINQQVSAQLAKLF